LGSNEPNTGTNKNAGQSPKYGHARSAHGSQNNQAKIRARFNDPYASSHQGHFSNNKMIEEAYNTAIQRYSTGYSSQGNWVVHVKVSRASYVYTRGGGTYTTKWVRVVFDGSSATKLRTAFPFLLP
ncbi:MAG: hypothetical protein L3J67_12640, partial [Hyphomicrobiaceae bacterium]|nr:hypothetical protein [Hyphomicrobiaceae bacterium]